VNSPANIPDSRLRQLDEAAEWIVRLGMTAPREEEVAEWLRWCEQQEGNLEAFEQLQRDWRDLGAIDATRVARDGNWRQRSSAWMGLAAAFVLAAVGLAYWRHIPPTSIALESSTRNRSATLPDGSSLVLSARSALDINFTGRERRLALNRGEAYFQVQHDARRPFIVQAGDLQVTAVGTVFDVRRERERIVVTVAEGSVGIVSDAGRGADRSAQWRASAGYQLSYAPGTRTASLVRVDPNRALGWRDGELGYIATPLATVIEEVNRYSDRHIRIQDGATAQRTYSGTVFIDSVDDWVRAVGATYSIPVEEAPDGEIVMGSSPE
jgi:transmembrane sensor